MHFIRRRQVRWVVEATPLGQREFIHTLLGIAVVKLAAEGISLEVSGKPVCNRSQNIPIGTIINKSSGKVGQPP